MMQRLFNKAMYRQFRIGVFLAVIGVANAHAEGWLNRDNMLPVDDNARLSVGLNASYNQLGYDKDSTVTVLPQAFYDNNRVYLEQYSANNSRRPSPKIKKLSDFIPINLKFGVNSEHGNKSIHH